MNKNINKSMNLSMNILEGTKNKHISAVHKLFIKSILKMVVSHNFTRRQDTKLLISAGVDLKKI